MTDVFTKAKRSAVMGRIRGAGNKDTELRLIGLMRAAGIRGWRRGRTIRGEGARAKVQEVEAASAARGARLKAKGRTKMAETGKEIWRGVTGRAFRVRPDFVFPRERVAVFVDGCFWHGCPVHGTQPKQNAAFWRAKIARNRARDRLVNRELRKAGWRVIRIWEHALRRKHEARVVRRLVAFLGRSAQRGDGRAGGVVAKR